MAATRDKGHTFLRVLTILERVVEVETATTPSALASHLGLPKASAYRLCQLLEQEQLLTRDLDGSGLVAGPRLRRLAINVLGSHSLRAARQAILESVAAEIGETCNITVPDGTSMVYQDRVESAWPLRIQLPVGSRVPLHCTASGKLFLSSLPSARRRRLVARIALEPHTANTITEPTALEAALKRIRSDGVGIDDEEFLDGMVAVAVPIKDPQGRLCATLATHGPAQRMSVARARAHIPTLQRAAAELSATLSGADGPGGANDHAAPENAPDADAGRPERPLGGAH